MFKVYTYILLKNDKNEMDDSLRNNDVADFLFAVSLLQFAVFSLYLLFFWIFIELIFLYLFCGFLFFFF